MDWLVKMQVKANMFKMVTVQAESLKQALDKATRTQKGMVIDAHLIEASPEQQANAEVEKLRHFKQDWLRALENA